MSGSVASFEAALHSMPGSVGSSFPISGGVSISGSGVASLSSGCDTNPFRSRRSAARARKSASSRAANACEGSSSPKVATRSAASSKGWRSPPWPLPLADGCSFRPRRAPTRRASKASSLSSGSIAFPSFPCRRMSRLVGYWCTVREIQVARQRCQCAELQRPNSVRPLLQQPRDILGGVAQHAAIEDNPPLVLSEPVEFRDDLCPAFARRNNRQRIACFGDGPRLLAFRERLGCLWMRSLPPVVRGDFVARDAKHPGREGQLVA